MFYICYCDKTEIKELSGFWGETINKMEPKEFKKNFMRMFQTHSLAWKTDIDARNNADIDDDKWYEFPKDKLE